MINNISFQLYSSRSDKISYLQCFNGYIEVVMFRLICPFKKADNYLTSRILRVIYLRKPEP